MDKGKQRSKLEVVGKCNREGKITRKSPEPSKNEKRGSDEPKTSLKVVTEAADNGCHVAPSRKQESRGSNVYIQRHHTQSKAGVLC